MELHAQVWASMARIVLVLLTEAHAITPHELGARLRVDTRDLVHLGQAGRDRAKSGGNPWAIRSSSPKEGMSRSRNR